jgi:hypothetical protein
MTGHDREHGIDGAVYTNGPFGLTPRLECVCGFITSLAPRSWEEAGAELDEHLRTVPRAEESTP